MVLFIYILLFIVCAILAFSISIYLLNHLSRPIFVIVNLCIAALVIIEINYYDFYHYNALSSINIWLSIFIGVFSVMFVVVNIKLTVFELIDSLKILIKKIFSKGKE